MDTSPNTNNSEETNNSNSNQSQTMPVLFFEENWTIDDYIRELTAGSYIIKEYFDIALNEIKLYHCIKIREMLKYELCNSRNKRHKNAFLNILRDTEKIYNQHLEDICDIYNIEFTYPYLEDTEMNKCIEYMSDSLIRFNTFDEVSNNNQTHINLYIIKIGIEIKYLETKLKNLEQTWNLGLE